MTNRRSKAAGRSHTIPPVALLPLIPLLIALSAPLIAPHDPTEQHLDRRLLPPGSEDHILGTDDFGRDVLSRILYGTRPALVIGFVAVSIGLIVGTSLGIISGLSPGSVDGSIMLLMDAILSFPTVLLAITIIAVIGYGLFPVTIALGIVFSPVFAREARATTHSIITLDFYRASRALGTPLVHSVVLHILPNLAGRVSVLAGTLFGMSVAAEASLSYLGLGTQPPNPSWGLMLKDARGLMMHAPWLAVYPGIALALLVLVLNVATDAVSRGLK